MSTRRLIVAALALAFIANAPGAAQASMDPESCDPQYLDTYCFEVPRTQCGDDQTEWQSECWANAPEGITPQLCKLKHAFCDDDYCDGGSSAQVGVGCWWELRDIH